VGSSASSGRRHRTTGTCMLCMVATRWLPSAPRQQRLVVRFLAVVNGIVKINGNWVGGVGLAASRYDDG
jgi:hypothetical protein